MALKEEIKVLARDLVILSWIYKVSTTLKTGKQDIWEKAGVTFLSKKINKEWKVINYENKYLQKWYMLGRYENFEKRLK